MLAIDPIVVSQSYAKPVDNRASARKVALDPIQASTKFSGFATQDNVEVSDEAKRYLKLDSPAEMPAIKQDARYGQVRAQVLNYLLMNGLPIDQAVTQADRILARMGYQGQAGKEFAGNQRRDADTAPHQGKSKPQNPKPMFSISRISGVNIVV